MWFTTEISTFLKGHTVINDMNFKLSSWAFPTCRLMELPVSTLRVWHMYDTYMTFDYALNKTGNTRIIYVFIFQLSDLRINNLSNVHYKQQFTQSSASAE